MAITSLALLTNRFGWSLYLEILSHFQVQYFVATLILAGLTLLLRHFRISLAILVCSAVLSAQVLPWYVPSHIGTQANYRVLVANLNFSNKDATKALALMDVEQPDLALFIEVGYAMEQQLASLGKTMPYSTNIAADSGLMLYSKYPLTDVHLQQFGLNTRKSLVAHLNINGQSLSLVAAHPLPPMEHRMFQSRNTLLADAGDYIKTQTGSVIFLGDLNITMWSPYYQALIHKTGLKNTRQGFGIRPTWPAVASYYGLPNVVQSMIKPLQIPIDHCLVSPEVTVVNSRTGAETGSDHFPVITDLWLKSGNVRYGFFPTFSVTTN
ncbi:endonuclease/exonuclease/phosphatase family protein [Leptothoe spongobia]|uniref:Endonuclease/exonuclease/phosphatase family protein n=1 Tax=Leptothoe spongobia TAU-MAC 1115 TaxID=1967444 RepID=A0A947GMZ0_9CYAN|nr:endonuclease/exonuclease/phosphatase family protein [Leptothoe spongobia]MBT9315776.1 endonuclease/exonuclease/phosphatase family protein [Leptothoe spongobia TAU-MAC 1115]